MVTNSSGAKLDAWWIDGSLTNKLKKQQTWIVWQKSVSAVLLSVPSFLQLFQCVNTHVCVWNQCKVWKASCWFCCIKSWNILVQSNQHAKNYNHYDFCNPYHFIQMIPNERRCCGNKEGCYGIIYQNPNYIHSKTLLHPKLFNLVKMEINSIKTWTRVEEDPFCIILYGNTRFWLRKNEH